MVNVNIKINDKIHCQARVLALKQKKSLIEYVNEAIKEKVARDS
ncbi:hypothetical protein LCGC14_3126270 [marine sediment metagenome]|uniref:Uncharacterized protein n=1 Tax=marine sediment metagenome TaxID=412755 RepID=A0A0F8W0W5_9ZZZZ